MKDTMIGVDLAKRVFQLQGYSLKGGKLLKVSLLSESRFLTALEEGKDDFSAFSFAGNSGYARKEGVSALPRSDPWADPSFDVDGPHGDDGCLPAWAHLVPFTTKPTRLPT